MELLFYYEICYNFYGNDKLEFIGVIITMINIRKATCDNLDTVLTLRYEMLMDVNKLRSSTFDEAFRTITETYFSNGDQTTVLAVDGEVPVGCATICYINLMPTFDHPTGKRAHFMNVYTRDMYRRRGIALKMMEVLISEAKEKGVSHLSLDATKDGRQLYYKLGFTDTNEGMEFSLIHRVGRKKNDKTIPINKLHKRF